MGDLWGLCALRQAVVLRAGRDGEAEGVPGRAPAGSSRASEVLGWVLRPSLGCPWRAVVAGRQGRGVRGKWRLLGWCWGGAGSGEKQKLHFKTKRFVQILCL